MTSNNDNCATSKAKQTREMQDLEKLMDLEESLDAMSSSQKLNGGQNDDTGEKQVENGEKIAIDKLSSGLDHERSEWKELMGQDLVLKMVG